MIRKLLATIYSFRLCLYNDKLIFVFNLEYMKFYNFVPVNLEILLKADTWILIACLVLWLCIVLFCMNISLKYHKLFYVDGEKDKTIDIYFFLRYYG